MIDPISVTSLTAAITAVANGTASEAGKQAWNALTGLVHKAFGRHSPPSTDLEVVGSSPSQEYRILELSTILASRAREQRSFADELATWLTDAKRDLDFSEGKIINTVSGHAQVQGPVFQGRDFTAPITFGAPPSGQPK
ncbi:MAG: hypothetical protein ACRDRR_01700 [Pseudonocardiaceae bacterium]